MMKRLLLAILVAFLLLAGPVQAFTVAGGTPEQRSDVYDTLVAVEFPTIAWVESKVGPVYIEILDSYPPWWVTALGSSDDVLIDEFSATAAGLAWPGNIKIHSLYVPGERTFFREIVSHEWSHQVWFALLYMTGASVEWKTRVEAGLIPNPAIWTQNYVEAHAEQLRIAAWTNLYWLTPYARTELNILGDDAVYEFHMRWVSATTTTTLPPTTTTVTAPPISTTTTAPPPPPTTTTTLPRGDPFLDVTREDTELWEAAWWGKEAGVWWGYPNGHFEPGQHLSRHQIAVLADRWIGVALPTLLADWGPATRGEVRDALPGLTWLEERWTEPITRSQLLRLQWRAL